MGRGFEDTMDEVWGTEVTVYYPGLYAGATDLVGIYNGAQIIGDFKQTNKPKRREWIQDYFLQLAAYGMAHNYVYRTAINSGVILMCSPDLVFQRFFVTPKEYQVLQWEWLKRVDLYYKMQGSGLRTPKPIEVKNIFYEKFFQIGVKRCYSVTKLKNIDISTLLEQKSVTPRCYKVLQVLQIPKTSQNNFLDLKLI